MVRAGLAPSRRAAQELIASGLVRVNGVRRRKAQTVSARDRVEVVGTLRAGSIEPNPDIAIETLYADDALIIVNKPGSMPCHPLRSDERDTVMNAVVAQFPETATAGDSPREGGLVHRLDNGTSGALIVARNRDAFAVLREAIRGGRIGRTYLALVCGAVTSSMELRAPIAHHGSNPRKMVPGEGASANRKRAGRSATTMVEPVRRVGRSTLVRATPRTGSRHQIRVHLADAGFPIVGDVLYGGAEVSGLPKDRFWLHLSELELDSPAGKHLKVTAPLPEELKSTMP
jgi:23S rRNA pseudouridine1911/1915/1917 synthase